MLNNKSTGSPFEEEIYSGDGYCLIYTLDGQEDYCTGDGPHVPFGSWFQEGAGGATAQGDGYEYDGSHVGFGGDDFILTKFLQVNPMLEIGSQVLVILPHGFVICGVVGEQKGVAAWQMHNVSLICRTNGVPWDELADGQHQEKPTYRKWGDVIVHNPIMVRVWKGQLP
jgi:hypothetical protein